MKKLSFTGKGWFASYVVLVFLLVAGWNFGTQPEAEFVETDMALENVIAGSGGGGYPYYYVSTEWCSMYYDGCVGPEVYKCRLYGLIGCSISGQIPCAEICT